MHDGFFHICVVRVVMLFNVLPRAEPHCKAADDCACQYSKCVFCYLDLDSLPVDGALTFLAAAA